MIQSASIDRTDRASRTREALCDAAFELFAVNGFDATTADQIAERAGVSPRAFFRYFATKASVVFHRDFGFMRWFAVVYVAQPTTLRDYDAVGATFISLCAEVEPLRSRVETYRRVIDASPLLLGLEREHLDEHAMTVADAVVRRSGGTTTEDDARTLGDVALALYQRALRRWLASRRRTALGDLVDGEFARLRTLACEKAVR